MNDYYILKQAYSNKMYYSVRIFINKLENKENPISLSSLGIYYNCSSTRKNWINNFDIDE